MKTADSSLNDWLARLETLSPHEIELGLDRVSEVLSHMALDCPGRVIHVAGTNGKGSSVTMLRSILQATGSIGTYMSPHVTRYNERICIDGVPVNDPIIVAAFERVEAARHDVPLTYFEFGTLAAMAVFESSGVDTAVLEVGMGGRLDAVNAIEPDAGLITNISLDHCEWLGDDVESIAFEKAGIMRTGKPVVFADKQMPSSIDQVAKEREAILVRAGIDYSWSTDMTGGWHWSGQRNQLRSLDLPALDGPIQVQNAAGVLALIEALGLDELLNKSQVDAAFGCLHIPGRMQLLQLERDWVLDVAHNPAAAAALSEALTARGVSDAVAIVGMLDDKDAEGVVRALDPNVGHWIATTVDNPRGIAASELARRIANETQRPCLVTNTADDAIEEARSRPGAQVLVTGSFYLVGPVLERLSPRD